jgi:hypothetical protein
MSGGMFGGMFSKARERMGNSTINPVVRNAKGQFAKGSGAYASKYAGNGMLKGGAGIAMAGIGLGAGIGIASFGISSLADSMNKLSEEKAHTLAEIVWAMTGLSAVGVLGSIAISAIGASSEFAAPGLFDFAAASVGVGLGIGLAASGIGIAATGISKLVNSTKNAGDGMFKIAAGLGAIAIASTVGGFSSLIGGAGMGLLAMSIKGISSQGDNMEKVGNAFKTISVAMRGSKDNFNGVQATIDSINKLNVSKGSAFSQLASILSKPLKVQFDTSKVNLVSDITLNIDGQKLVDRLHLVRTIAVNTQHSISKGGIGS